MLARVFPRKTNATPDDQYAFVGDVPLFYPQDITEVHISCTFSYDRKEAERLFQAWSRIAPCKIGGVAFGDKGGDFVCGRYVKTGMVMTSRGCNNNCWFCSVPKREGKIRELPIVEGYNIIDSNLLQCSRDHQNKVFEMLSRQKEPAEFTGGIEAKLLEWYHVEKFYELKPKSIFFAYDTEDDLEPLIEAGKKLYYANINRNKLYCYVLIGYPKDTLAKAEKRLFETWESGFTPFAMLYKDKEGNEDGQWRNFQRKWVLPAITKALIYDEIKRRSLNDGKRIN
jgi:hypothetical protein